MGDVVKDCIFNDVLLFACIQSVLIDIKTSLCGELLP